MTAAFWLPLLVKAVSTALVVVTASVAAERGGPFWGGIAVTLPLTAGPAYVMLALARDPDFIAASALASFAAYPATWAFLSAAVRLAPRVPWWATLGAALTAWLAAILLLQQVAWTVSGAAAINVAAYAIGFLITRKSATYVHVRKELAKWPELLGRAALVGVFVGLLVTVSGAIGPGVTGIAAVFPLVLSSLTVVLHRKLGGPAVAATMRHAVHSIAGTGAALGALHLLLTTMPVWPAMGLSLLVAMAWSGMLVLRRRLFTPRGA